MLPKPCRKLLSIVVAGTLTTSCGLLPSFGNDSMNRTEEAKLNLQMGVRYLDMGMLDVAKEKLELAADLDSGNAEIHNALAVFYERVKNFDEAADRYKSAIDHDPDDFGIKNNYGRFLCDRGEYEKGMVLLQESIDSPMNNRPWLALTNMGNCLLGQNNQQRGEDYFRQALQQNGEYAPALMEMQKISYNKQQYMSARAFLERYLSVGKHTPTTLWIAFQTERALGNSQAADDYKAQLILNFPTSKETQQVKSAISK